MILGNTMQKNNRVQLVPAKEGTAYILSLIHISMKVAKVGVALSGESAVAVGSTTKLTNTKKNSSRAKITYTSSDLSLIHI